MEFITCKQPRRLWWPGTVHEAQCWQLKAAIQSALEDIRVNHPNDFCGLVYFASSSNYNTPRVPMGQQWADLKHALYYNGPRGSNPTNLLPVLRYTPPATHPPDTTTEHTPYNPNLSGFNGSGYLSGILPNANGGTDPISGFAMSFNILSTSPSKAAQNPAGTHGGTGRLGAAKIVIYETDGVPNGTDGWTITGFGTDTRYNQGGSNETYPVAGLPDPLTANGVDYVFDPFPSFASAPAAISQALAAVQRTVAPVTTSTSVRSGFSLPNAPCRVYPIGFGDLFDGYDGTNTWPGPAAATNGVKFLRRTGQLGNTLPIAGDPPLPLEYIITGSYQNRINNLRTLLERIMQSGVQVTLIE
jgi:hypothetical protein